MDRDPFDEACIEVESVGSNFVLVESKVAEKFKVDVTDFLTRLEVVSRVLEFDKGTDILVPIKIVDVLCDKLVLERLLASFLANTKHLSILQVVPKLENRLHNRGSNFYFDGKFPCLRVFSKLQYMGESSSG